MPTKNYLFNIVTFDFPEGDQVFYFSKEEKGMCHRLYWSQFPNDIENIFPGIKSDGTEFIYTTYDFEKDGFFPLAVDLRTENPDLIKKYYNRKVFHYFKKVAHQIAKQGFINETVVWLPSAEKSQQFTIYDRFSLRVQLCTVSNYPELLISYDGKGRVLKQSVSELITEVTPKNFNWILQEQSLFKYDKMAEFEDPDYDTAFPVLNNSLRRAMQLGTEAPVKGNKYHKYWAYIQNFYIDYLNTDDFKEVIPLHDTGFFEGCSFKNSKDPRQQQ